jgi:hypothetical protein
MALPNTANIHSDNPIEWVALNTPMKNGLKRTMIPTLNANVMAIGLTAESFTTSPSAS